MINKCFTINQKYIDKRHHEQKSKFTHLTNKCYTHRYLIYEFRIQWLKQKFFCKIHDEIFSRHFTITHILDDLTM